MQESRVKKTLLNARVNLIFYFLTLVLSFFSRKIFLNCLGAGFVGLTGTLQNLLGFLNLAELGIGSAIGYLLYKPLFDHDEKKINEIISVMGYLYRWIGFIILGAGCILACFLPLIFPDSDTGFPLSLIYFAYFAFLGSSLIGYFINYRQNLLGADQRNYVVTAYFQTATIIKTIIQMAAAYYTANYYLWVIIEFTFGIIYSIILNWKINQTYPWLHTEIALGRKLLKKYPLIIKNTKKIFLHKVGIVTQFQAMPILIYAFSSLQLVAYYVNYTIIIDKVNVLINNFLGSSEAAVGNLIAEGNRIKVLSVFWECISLRFWICGFVCTSCYTLMNLFITLWLGEGYILPNLILVLILINYGIPMIQNSIGQFTYGFGLFNDVWATLTSAILFILLSILWGVKWGLVGVLISSIVSLVFLYIIWKPYYLFHYGFNISVSSFWVKWLRLFMVVLSVSIISFLISERCFSLVCISNLYIGFTIKSCIVVLCYFVLSIIGLGAISQDFRNLVKRFIKLKSE